MNNDDFLTASERLRRMLGPSEQIREQLRLLDAPGLKAIAEAHKHSQLASQFMRDIGGAERIRELSDGMRSWREAKLAHKIGSGESLRVAQGWLDSPTLRAAQEFASSPHMLAVRDLARRAEQIALPAALADYRSSLATMADRISVFDHDRLLGDATAFAAFARTSAFSDAISQSARVDTSLIDAARAYSLTAMPAFASFAAQRAFLDAAGLRLPRWPRIRLLTAAEKRKRFKARLQHNAETPEVKRAKSLVHRYELTMREIIDAAMAETYGEDWADHRLPLCDCKTLLGKRDKRGGEPLDHADYAHYRLIMSHPQHFADIFHLAFPDPPTVAQLIDDAGRLRAASHHARDFTTDDLRDLRVVWRMLEAGLLALTEDIDFDGWH